MSVYVTDTHALIYYALDNPSRLSQRALDAFEAASRREAFIWIPPVVLEEVSSLYDKRLRAKAPFRYWVERLLLHRGFGLAEWNQEMIIQAHEAPFRDSRDAAIAATARVMDLPLITRDGAITDSGWVRVWW